MGRFDMVCPKCHTTDYTIERDNRSYSDARFGLIFSCRCGRQLFGEAVLKEHQRQLKEWEASTVVEAPPPPPPEDPKEEQLRAAFAARADYVRKRREEEAERERSEKEAWERKWNSSKDEQCEWEPCTNKRRPNSKYCSRACSNKNARSRYKRRRRGNNEEEAA